MNIIIDKYLADQLEFKRTIFKVECGSVLYGFQNENSDKDIYRIYMLNEKELSSLLGNTHYQLQLRAEWGDNLYASLQGFFRNCVNGGSTICFEILHTPEFRKIFNIDPQDFYNFSIVKGYLGLVKRDLERLHKLPSLYDKRKCLAHAYRGYIFAREIMEGRRLRLKISDYEEAIQKNFDSIRNFERPWEQGDDDVADFIYDRTMDLRAQAVERLQKKEMPLYMDPVKQRDLDNYLYTFSKQQSVDLTCELDLQVVREFIENGVKQN